MHWKPRGWTLIGMLLLAIPGAMTAMKVTAAAQASGSTIATTQVTDTLYRADGTPATGSVIVSWQAFTTASGQAVPSGTTSATITGGALSLQLVPNGGSTPMGTYYTAVYHLDDGSVSREFWVVPVSQFPVLVSAIRSTVLPTSVAMQTVSKSYVDTAIASAVTGHPLDSSPYVIKSGDTMTGALVLPGDPTTPNDAADKHYVDVNIAAATGGLGQVSPSGGAMQLAANLLVRYALTEGSGAPQDTSGNGNHATLPGGGANPTWTAQGISCDGASQYFNSVGTRGARTFVWSSTEQAPLNAAVPTGPQFVTPFGVADLSVLEGGNNYYGSHPGVGINGTFNSQSNDTLQGTHTYALTLGTNASTDPDRFYVDGVETTYVGARGGSAGFATAAYEVCGVQSGFPTYFPGSFYYFEAFSDEKTPVQIARETNAVTQIAQGRGVAFKTAPSPTINNLYIAVGDSLTNGEGVNPSSQFVAPSDTFDVVNYGLGNSDSDDLFELFDAREATIYRHNAGRNVLRLWVGTNDVSTRGRTPQQALDGIRAYCRKAKAAGFQTIVSDMISRTGNDTNMLALDGLLTTQDTGCDLGLDLASNPLLGAVGANANTTYYQGDNTHLTQAGQQTLVAPAETRAINLLARLKSSNSSATVTSATYAMADYDLYLPINPAANSVAATLPDCNYFTGLTRSIKNLQSSGSNAVTVAPASGQLIDGSASAITVANGATLVLRQIVPNRTTAGCMWVKVSNN
jgi:trimeric autotransporter adhesin